MVFNCLGQQGQWNTTPGSSARAAGSRLGPYTETDKPGGRIGQAGERERGRGREILDVLYVRHL